MNTALSHWRKRLASAAAAWIAVTMAVAFSLPSSPASADEPGVGDPIYVAHKMQGYSGSAMVGIFATTPPDIGNLGTPDYWSYCVEHDISVGTFRTATLEAPPSFLGGNYFTSAAIQAKVLWVLAHSYPYLSLSDFGTAAGVPGISANDAIEATQYAIWRYTDLNFDAAWNWETPDSEAAYWYLVNGANASSGMIPADLQSTAAIIAPGGTHVAGTLVGPFTISTNQPVASLSVTGGYTLTDAGGTAIDTSAVTNGQAVYIDLTGVTTAGSATVTVSAAGSSITGNIISVPATPGGVATPASHAQTLMIVAPSTARVTDSASVSWGPNGSPAFAFCPAAGDPTQVFSLVNGVNIYGYTPPGATPDTLLPLLPATVSGNLNALMLDPVRNRLLMIQRSSGTESTLWAYDPANGGWYVAFGPFVSPDFPRGGFSADGTGYLLGGGSTPEVWEVESSSTFGYTVTSLGVMNYDQAPTDFSSGDIAFDGSGRAWLAVGQDLYHLDLSGSSPFPAVRQTRPLLGGSPSTIGWAGIAFADDGTLILANNAPAPSAYYQYDPATGVIVHLSNTTANASRDLASCAFPARSDPALSVAKTLTAVNGAPYTPPSAVSPGDTLTYRIAITNSGGAAATLFAGDVVETVPADTTHVGGDSFTCAAATAGSSCGNTSTFNVAAGAGVDLSFTVQVGATPTGASITNAVAIPGEVDCAVAPNDCEEETPVLAPANVSLTKTLSAESGTLTGQAEAGEQLTYTITLTNAGGSDATNYGVEDRLDPNTDFVSATNGGTFAAGVVSWSGLTVPANGSLVLTVIVQVADPLPAGVTQVANLAYETGTPPPPCPPAGGQCVVVPTAGAVTIAKSVQDASGDGLAAPGEQLTYAIVLTNTGGSDATSYAVTDPLDANTVFVSADNGGTFAAGVVSWSGLTVPANGTLTLTVVVRVVDPVPPGVTRIGNVAYQTGTTPPDCEATPQPANCTSIEVPPPTGVPQLLITKTANTSILRPGATVVYTVTVRNVGSADAIGALISDPIPAGIDTFAWTCTASGGVACPNASGSGAIAETVATFPVGATLVYTVTAAVSADPPDTVVNTATVTPRDLAICAPAGTPPPCAATLIGTVTPTQPPLPVPAVHRWAQLLIALSLFGLAWRGWRRAGR